MRRSKKITARIAASVLAMALIMSNAAYGAPVNAFAEENGTAVQDILDTEKNENLTDAEAKLTESGEKL